MVTVCLTGSAVRPAMPDRKCRLQRPPAGGRTARYRSLAALSRLVPEPFRAIQAATPKS